MWKDPASVTLIAIAALCGVLSTVALLRRLQQGRATRRSAQHVDRSLIREYRTLRDEITALVGQLDSALDRLNERLDRVGPPAAAKRAAPRTPSAAPASSVTRASTPLDEPLDAADVVEWSDAASTPLGADEVASNLRRFEQGA